MKRHISCIYAIFPNVRPGDVMIRRWANGKDAAIDITVTGPQAVSNVEAATAKAGTGQGLREKAAGGSRGLLPGGSCFSSFRRGARDTWWPLSWCCHASEADRRCSG